MARARVAAAATAALIGLLPAAATAPASAAGQKPVIVRVDKGGFHWVDAGLGSAATLGVLILVAAGRAAHKASAPTQREES